VQPQEALRNAILLIVEVYVIVLKKSIFIYAVGMQHMRVCLDQISHFLNPFLFMYDLTHFSLAFLARHARLNMGHELQEMVDFLVDIWEQEGLYD